MKYNSDKIFILFIVAIIIISAFLYKGYSINLQEEKEKGVINAQLIKEKEIIKEKEEKENKENEEKRINLENCLTLVEERVDRLFKSNFKNCDTISGINFKCLNEIEIGAEKIRKEGKSECFKKYPQ